MHRQSGVALIGVLGVVLVAALLAVNALERSFFQTRTMHAAMDRQQAMAAAEGAMQRAIHAPARYASTDSVAMLPSSAIAWRDYLQHHGTAFESVVPLQDDAPPPRVLVESLNPDAYRVTSLGQGTETSTFVVLQSMIVPAQQTRIWRELR